MPPGDCDVPAFLEELKAGGGGPGLFVDTEQIELAFDFRPENPSLQRLHQGRTGAVRAPTRFAFRTRSGHVPAADAPDLQLKLHRDHPFLALQGVVQVTGRGPIRLPTLTIARRLLTLVAALPDGAEPPGQLLPEPLGAAMADPSHLLDRRLPVDDRAGAAEPESAREPAGIAV